VDGQAQFSVSFLMVVFIDGVDFRVVLMAGKSSGASVGISFAKGKRFAAAKFRDKEPAWNLRDASLRQLQQQRHSLCAQALHRLLQNGQGWWEQSRNEKI
jgi:hypothetical protein